MRHPYPFRLLAIASASALLLTACGGDDDPLPVAEETRPQDSRTAFAPADPTATTFAAMANGTAETDGTSRWAGVLNGAAYRVEVPANWNGKLVMYAHGYAGTGNALGVNNPSIRRHLLMNGYSGPAQFVVLGTGASHYEDMFRQLAGFHREKMSAYIGLILTMPFLLWQLWQFIAPGLYQNERRYASAFVVSATYACARIRTYRTPHSARMRDRRAGRAWCGCGSW